MYNLIGNQVGITGNVTIQTLKNGKVIDKVTHHNTATTEMCEYLRDALTGNNNHSYRPGRLVPLDVKNEPMFGGGGIHYQPDSIENKDSGDGWASNTLQFVIPRNLLNKGDIIKGFWLCRNILDDEGELVPYAKIYLPDKIIIEDNKTSLRVDWTIKISISKE